MPQEAKSGVETIKEPTVSWADFAVSGTRSPRSYGGEKEEAHHQSIQTGYGDEHQVEDGKEIQEHNTHSTGVVSEKSEELERGAIGGSDYRNNRKVPCVEGRPGVEDSMDCGEEILGDTNATVECQPLFRQPQENMNTTTESREEEERGRGKQEIRSGAVVEDRTQPVEEVRTTTPSSSPIRKKK